MRVPIPLVLFLSLAVIAAVWWNGTRKTDFLTTPPAAKLAEIRSRVESQLPAKDPVDTAPAAVAVTEVPDAPTIVAQPAIDLGDINHPPTLQEYSEFTSKGTTCLMDLAALLEAKGAFQRALLAWERVLDTGSPNVDQSTLAIAAIKRLRPSLPAWNTDRSKTITINLHAGTGNTKIKSLSSILKASALEIERASSGILKVTPIITSRRSTMSSSAPVALRLAGTTKGSIATPVLSFTIRSQQSLRDDLLKALFLLLSDSLGHEPSNRPPPLLNQDTKPLDALNNHITRLQWQQLGIRLNTPQKKDD